MRNEKIALLDNLGFEINDKKLMAPTAILTFLGIQFDTVKCELSLPNKITHGN